MINILQQFLENHLTEDKAKGEGHVQGGGGECGEDQAGHREEGPTESHEPGTCFMDISEGFYNVLHKSCDFKS